MLAVSSSGEATRPPDPTPIENLAPSICKCRLGHNLVNIPEGVLLPETYSKVPNKHTGVIIYFRIAVHPVRSLFRTVCLFFFQKFRSGLKKIILGGAFIWKFSMFRVYNNTYKLYIWQMGYLLCELIVYYAPCLHSAFIWFWEFVRGCSYSAQCFYLILRIFPGGALIPVWAKNAGTSDIAAVWGWMSDDCLKNGGHDGRCWPQTTIKMHA